MTMTNATLGSMSDIKMKALREAALKVSLKIFPQSVRATSGQNSQPVGFIETYYGALARAREARKHDPKGLAIGIENGIFRSGPNEEGITLDIAIIVVLTEDGRKIVTSSAGIQFPQEYVSLAEMQGFKTTTVGSVIAEKLGGPSDDPHSTLTGGKVTREALLTDALVVALSQI